MWVLVMQVQLELFDLITLIVSKSQQVQISSMVNNLPCDGTSDTARAQEPSPH